MTVLSILYSLALIMGAWVYPRTVSLSIRDASLNGAPGADEPFYPKPATDGVRSGF